MATTQEIVRQKALAAFGPQEGWTPEQLAAYRAAVLERQTQVALELEQERQAEAARVATAIGQGLQSAGQSIQQNSQTDPLILYKMNHKHWPDYDY